MSQDDSSKTGLLELMEKLQEGHGTVEQAEEWLARLEDINPYFHSSDAMLSLQDMVRERRRAEQIRAQLVGGNGPLNKTQLTELVRGVNFAKARGSEEISDMMARLRLFQESVPHPDANELVARFEEGKMTAEEVVEAAFAFQPIALPGSVDSNCRPS